MTGALLIGAFIGGLVSFLAPCVLPIIPGFLSYLAGVGTSELSSRRRDVFTASVFFVLGFSVIFAALGVLLNTLLSGVAYEVQRWLARGGGVLIIFFGLYLLGLVRIPFLEREYKFGVTAHFNSRNLTSFIFGVAFAVGWTPCVGPALGVILGLAATAPGSAFALLLVYALGLGIPFLVVGAFTAQASSFIDNHSLLLRRLNVIFGVILLALGVLVFTQRLSLIANFDFLNRYLVS